MRKYLLALSLLFVTAFVFAQDEEAAKKLVDEGVAYNDKGDYEGALAKYDKALATDKDNVLALAEKAYTLLAMQKYSDAIPLCQRAIEKHPGDVALKSVYVSYGNAYDGLKKTDKSLEVYDEGIKAFPESYMLPFNKGITLLSIKKYDDAMMCFQKSATLNPKHASTQNAMARILDMKNKRIPALLAFGRFMIIEPTSARAKEDLGLIKDMIKGSAEKTGKKSITVNISPDMLADTAVNGIVKENSFTSTDLLLSMDAALDFDKKNKNKTEVEQFARKFNSVCASLKETRDGSYGFYWEYYVPYFVELKDKGYVETFSYLVYASSDDADVAKWLKSHKEDINKFYAWSKEYDWKTKSK